MHRYGWKKAQSIIEFSVGMVVVCLIIYGMVAVFRWGMMDMVERRYDHDESLMNISLATANQLNPNFHEQRPMDAVVRRK